MVALYQVKLKLSMAILNPRQYSVKDRIRIGQQTKDVAIPAAAICDAVNQVNNLLRLILDDKYGEKFSIFYWSAFSHKKDGYL